MSEHFCHEGDMYSKCYDIAMVSTGPLAVHCRSRIRICCLLHKRKEKSTGKNPPSFLEGDSSRLPSAESQESPTSIQGSACKLKVSI